MDSVRWRDLPVGTIFEKEGHKYKKLDEEYEVCIEYPDDFPDHMRNYKAYKMAINDILIDFKITYPQQYQSPLWKVLNGESIEGEE